MKVVLLQNVPHVGKKFDVINVKDGYAFNFLFPKKLAERLTPQIEKELEKKRKNQMIKAEEIKAMEKEIIEKIKTLSEITLKRKMSSKGHLFASITEKDVMEKVTEAIHVELEPANVKMKSHIKESGKHEIIIHIGETNTPLLLNIESEE